MGHTKGKWEVKGSYITSDVLSDEHYEIIKEHYQGKYLICESVLNPANAKRIVHCVNTYDKLLEACKYAYKTFKEQFEQGFTSDYSMNKIKQAIAKADDING